MAFTKGRLDTLYCHPSKKAILLNSKQSGPHKELDGVVLEEEASRWH